MVFSQFYHFFRFFLKKLREIVPCKGFIFFIFQPKSCKTIISLTFSELLFLGGYKSLFFDDFLFFVIFFGEKGVEIVIFGVVEFRLFVEWREIGRRRPVFENLSEAQIFLIFPIFRKTM